MPERDAPYYLAFWHVEKLLEHGEGFLPERSSEWRSVIHRRGVSHHNASACARKQAVSRLSSDLGFG
jgi:hypothetical protein